MKNAYKSCVKNKLRPYFFVQNMTLINFRVLVYAYFGKPYSWRIYLSDRSPNGIQTNNISLKL